MAQVVTCTAAAFFFGEGLRVSAASKKVSEPALIGACPFCVELCMGSFSSEIYSATWFTLDCGSFSTLLNTSTRAGMMEAGVLEEVSRAFTRLTRCWRPTSSAKSNTPVIATNSLATNSQLRSSSSFSLQRGATRQEKIK